MCKANDLPLSLKSDTFNALCSDSTKSSAAP